MSRFVSKDFKSTPPRRAESGYKSFNPEERDTIESMRINHSGVVVGCYGLEERDWLCPESYNDCLHVEES